MTYWAYVHVYDPDGNPVEGVQVRLDVEAWLFVPPDVQEYFSGSDVRETDANGVVFLEVDVPEDYELLSMRASVPDPDYTTLSATRNYTTTAYYLYPEFVVALDLDGNGISDEWELPLAEKFCPTLVPNHPTGWLAPESVEIMGVSPSQIYVAIYDIGDGHCLADLPSVRVLEFSPVDGAVPLVPDNYSYIQENPRVASLYVDWDGNGTYEGPANYVVLVHNEWAGVSGNDPDAWESAYEGERSQNHFRNTVYAHLFLCDSGIAIQYWFFYPYNDFINNHEGDWEHINVIVDREDPELAQIERVDFYFHHKVDMRDMGTIQIEDGSHPVVFVGGQHENYAGVVSGGSYPSPGHWPDVGAAGADEDVNGSGPRIPYSSFIDGDPNDGRGIVVLHEPDCYDYDQTPEMSWLKANIAWGHPSVSDPWAWVPSYDGNFSPGGPYYNPGWSRVGAVPGAFDPY